tara:strand:- start:1880 stop:2524 length:645 start_codon:yes stop_codon:yes gene_type:complete
MDKLRRRVLDICYNNKLSHLGTYFSSLKIINDIYEEKELDEVFVLSSGHAAVALYAVIEKFHGVDAEYLFKKHGGHPHRDEENFLYCSTGSLGCGLPIAVGRALADPDSNVYCLISDGECAEGSIWESLRFIQENAIKNIKVYVNVNGYCAYDKVDSNYLISRLKSFYPDINIVKTSVGQYPFLCGINAHYHVMGEEDYKMAIKMEDSIDEKKV